MDDFDRALLRLADALQAASTAVTDVVQARERREQQTRPETPPPTQATDGPWLTVAAAAAYAHRGVRTINAALLRGELRGYQNQPGTPASAGARQKRGGTWRIHIDDLDAWIERPLPGG